jgi:ATP/maltotriose-dependent transcriptional regulator MalT
MAYVYRAYQPALERFVAIKVLPVRHALANKFSERFVREARTVAQLNHPNILPILDFGQETEFSYIVTKLVPGGTLKDRLGQVMALSEVARIIEQIAAALDHAHSRGVLHRDVKPSNVLLDDGDWVLLADFGLAKMMIGDEGLTATGVGIGTPSYMSPEQGQGLAVDHRSDIYSLGVILYEIVTGQLPYNAETPMGVVFKHIYEPLTLPRLVRSDVSPLVEAVILKAMEKKPEDRYAWASEMAQALWEAVKASESGAMAAAKQLTPLVDDVSTQPTLALDAEESEAAPTPAPDAAPVRTPPFEITPPPETPQPPKVAEFVGRQAELAYFSEKLAGLNLAIIVGMAGVGKTSLMAQLVQQTAELDQAFWHTFYEGEGVEALIWRLAGFLYWRGQQELWRMLQGTQQNGGQHPPAKLLVDYIVQMLRGRAYTLCLDDLHLVEDDRLLAQLIERLYQAATARELSLLIASRRVPETVPAGGFEPLSGLSAADTHALLAARGFVGPAELVADLYAQTEGNAQLLTLATEALERTASPEHLIAHLTEAVDIEHYLLSEVDAGLTQLERQVMSAVAVLMGHPGTRDAVEALVDSASVRRVLGELTRRQLLSVSLGERGKAVVQHAMVRSFYYDLLGPRARREMHRRAGRFYESAEPDVLKAALHYERAGQRPQAARLATDNVWQLINQGRARALGRLLGSFTMRKLEPQLWVEVNIARAEIHTLRVESQLARASYQEALSTLHELPVSSQVRELKARVCRGMGELLQYESPREALDWLQRGLVELHGMGAELEADLHIRLGGVQIALGDYAASRTALERGLALLPEGPSQSRAGALMNLGTIYMTQGDLQRGAHYYADALQISQQLHDDYQVMRVWGALGVGQEIAGDWRGAIAFYERARKQAEKLGSLVEQARLELLMGILRTNQGRDDQARSRLSACIKLSQAGNLYEFQIAGQSSLADLLIRQGDPEAAKPMLAEAERLALEIGAQDQLPEIYRAWAQAQLASGQPEAALGSAERAADLAGELGLDLEEGQSLRVLGQTLIAVGRTQPGTDAFEKSLSLLAGDPYEAARTKMEWGSYLASDTDVDYGLTLLQEARATFQELVAKRDLAAVDDFLGTVGNS